MISCISFSPLLCFSCNRNFDSKSRLMYCFAIKLFRPSHISAVRLFLIIHRISFQFSSCTFFQMTRQAIAFLTSRKSLFLPVIDDLFPELQNQEPPACIFLKDAYQCFCLIFTCRLLVYLFLLQKLVGKFKAGSIPLALHTNSSQEHPAFSASAERLDYAQFHSLFGRSHIHPDSLPE